MSASLVVRDESSATTTTAATTAAATTAAGVSWRTHRALSRRIWSGMNSKLWAGDHFKTSPTASVATGHRASSPATTRDHIDYDANLLAIAARVAPIARARLVVARIDNGT